MRAAAARMLSVNVRVHSECEGRARLLALQSPLLSAARYLVLLLGAAALLWCLCDTVALAADVLDSDGCVDRAPFSLPQTPRFTVQ